MDDMLFKDESAERFFRGELEKLKKEIVSLRRADVQISRSLGARLCSITYSLMLNTLSWAYVAEGRKDPHIYDLIVNFLTERLPKTVRKLSYSKKVKDVIETLDEFDKEILDVARSLAKIKGFEKELNEFIEKFEES